MRLASNLEIDLAADARRSERFGLERRASVREGDRVTVEVELVNISSAGCRLATRGRLPEGAFVWLRVAGLESWAAKVVWSRAGSAGCRFFRPLAPAVVQRLVSPPPRLG